MVTSTVLTKDLKAVTYEHGSNKCVKPHPLAITCLTFPVVKKSFFFLAVCYSPQLLQMRKLAGDEQVNVLFGTEQRWKWFHCSPPAATLQGELRNINHAQTELTITQGVQSLC